MDKAYFERMFDYYKVLRFFAMRIVKDMSYAEDIVQVLYRLLGESGVDRYVCIYKTLSIYTDLSAFARPS